jgi:hypothetical protein
MGPLRPEMVEDRLQRAPVILEPHAERGLVGGALPEHVEAQDPHPPSGEMVGIGGPEVGILGEAVDEGENRPVRRPVEPKADPVAADQDFRHDARPLPRDPVAT